MGWDFVVELVHTVVGKSDLLCAQVKIRHIAFYEQNNNKKYNC
jgi:hypothetical protein